MAGFEPAAAGPDAATAAARAVDKPRSARALTSRGGFSPAAAVSYSDSSRCSSSVFWTGPHSPPATRTSSGRPFSSMAPAFSGVTSRILTRQKSHPRPSPRNEAPLPASAPVTSAAAMTPIGPPAPMDEATVVMLTAAASLAEGAIDGSGAV